MFYKYQCLYRILFCSTLVHTTQCARIIKNKRMLSALKHLLTYPYFSQAPKIKCSIDSRTTNDTQYILHFHLILRTIATNEPIDK